nr:peroxidase 60-like [Tanacetum cinerariifolium]
DEVESNRDGGIVLAGKGLEAKAIVKALSQKIESGLGRLTCKSLNKHCSQVISHVQSANALYSAFVDDLDTTNYFLKVHDIRQGRRDGFVSLAQNTQSLPGPYVSVGSSIQAFARKGLNVTDMIYLLVNSLSGHTIGIAHCSLFQDRLYNFQSTWRHDPTLNSILLPTLMRTCPQNSVVDRVVNLDQNPSNSRTMDNSFYKQIMMRSVILEIDQQLARDRLSKSTVKAIASTSDFNSKFGQFMVKLGGIQVLTGKQGEIRQKYSSCGALYTTDYCCSDGSLGDKIICDLNKIPDLSQRSPQNCPKCGNPVDGHYCQGCTLLRKKFKEDLFTYCIENGILQDSFEPSNDNTNVVNALQDPFVVKQDLGENSSQGPPQISHHCCYGCGDPLEDIFCRKCTCELCGREDILELFQRLHNDVQNIHEELAIYINTLSWDRPTVCYYDDDEDYAIAVTPSSLTKEPDNSLSMGDEHLDTVPATKSDKFIKSGVESLVPIPSESEGIPDNMCDMPFHDNSPPLNISKDQFEDFSDSNDESTSINDDSFSIDNIEYVEVSPPDSELVSSEVMEIVIPESSSTSFNSLLEETNTFDNSLPEFKIFCFDLEEISSGSTTTRSNISLPEYEAFYDNHVKEISSGSTTTHSDSSLYDSFIFDLSINLFPPADMSDFYEFADELTHIISPPECDCFCFKNEPNLGDFTMDVVEDTFLTKEPRVHIALPTHPILLLNLVSYFLVNLFSLIFYGSFFLFSHIQLLLNIFYLSRMKTPFLIQASAVIISFLLCRMYLIRVELL